METAVCFLLVLYCFVLLYKLGQASDKDCVFVETKNGNRDWLIDACGSTMYYMCQYDDRKGNFFFFLFSQQRNHRRSEPVGFFSFSTPFLAVALFNRIKSHEDQVCWVFIPKCSDSDRQHQCDAFSSHHPRQTTPCADELTNFSLF